MPLLKKLGDWGLGWLILQEELLDFILVHVWLIKRVLSRFLGSQRSGPWCGLASGLTQVKLIQQCLARSNCSLIFGFPTTSISVISFPMNRFYDGIVGKHLTAG